MRKCILCGAKHKAKGLCRRHYRQRQYVENRERELSLNKAWLRKNRKRRADYMRAYYRTESGNIAVKKSAGRYRQKNRLKVAAWSKVQHREHLPCAMCGKLPSHRHHPDYGKPDRFVHLCALHHKQVHNKVIQ